MSVNSYHRIFMGESVIATESSFPNVLGTNGLLSCIGFAGFDPQKRIAFLVHFGGPKQVDDFYSRGVALLSKGKESETLCFQCAIRGGCQKTSASAEILAKLKEGLFANPKVRFEVVEESPPSKTFVSKSLSVNCLNGKFDDYDIENDPNPRKKTLEEELRDQTLSPFEELWYRVQTTDTL